MIALVLGLLLFLGVHSVRVAAEPWRQRTIARVGEGRWKGLYSLLSIVGFALLVWGYVLARPHASPLWAPPLWTRHVAGLLMLLSLVLLAAAYVPRNSLKARLHHPMLLAVKVWALAHLLANGTIADVLLFGSFLVWAVLDFRAARRRDAAERITYPPGRASATLATLAIGIAAWAALAFGGHALLFGVAPFLR